MRLSALEIKKKEFQQKMRGADLEEVQAFLDQVSGEVETLTLEKKELETTLASTRERLEYFLSLEQVIEKTLVASQQTAVKMEDQARREAELILRDASLERDRKLADVRTELEHGEREVFRLRTEYDMTLSRMRAVSSSFSGFLDTLEVDRKPAKPLIDEPLMSAPPLPVEPLPTVQVASEAPTLPAILPEQDPTPTTTPSLPTYPEQQAYQAPAPPQPWMPTPLPPNEQLTWGN